MRTKISPTFTLSPSLQNFLLLLPNIRTNLISFTAGILPVADTRLNDIPFLYLFGGNLLIIIVILYLRPE